MDVAVLLRKNVYKPLEEVAIHKQTQTHKLTGYRDQLEETMDTVEHDLQVVCGRVVLLVLVCVLGGMLCYKSSRGCSHFNPSDTRLG